MRALKPAVGERIAELYGIVTVSDDGGSSGRLRREFGVPAPGDIRNCLVALADDEALVARLFQYRFANGEGLAGHSFGNLFLTALTGITGDFYQAILTAESILAVRGRILPATLADVRLNAQGASGRTYEGESAIGLAGEAIASIELVPPHAPAFPEAAEVIRTADLILLGPGSLYTSILPNLLIPGILDALRRRQGPAALVLNLMTQPGETEKMNARAHVDAIEKHARVDLLDVVLAHQGALDQAAVDRYGAVGAEPVEVEIADFADKPFDLVSTDLVAEGGLIRHDPVKLLDAVLDLVGPRP